MSLLDIPKTVLDYNVWNSKTLQLNPDIEKQILETILKIVDFTEVKEIFILGSITGYQWDANSDIDVNVRIPLELITADLHIKRKLNNANLAVGTKHPIHYFFQPYDKPASWQDSYFGVYDVINQKWVVLPPARNTIRDPKEEYYFDLITANMQLEEFRRILKNWKHYKNIQNPTLKDRQLENKFFMEAREFAKFLDEDRKLEYEYGWGIPRKNWRNIVYKFIEHSDVGPDFEYLKEIKDDQL